MTTEPQLTIELLRAALESSSAGVLMVDVTGQIVLINSEIERLFGYARDDLLGQSVDRLVPERLRGGHSRLRATFFESPERRAMGAGRELFGMRADGVEIPVEIGLSPIETSEGRFVLALVVDISERKQAEAQRRMLEAQLRQAQKMEAVGRLASGIAHDFKNLLAGILGCSGLAIRALEAGDQPTELLREIKTAAERGTSLSRQLLDFGRDQNSPPAPLVLNVAVRAAERMLRRVIGEDVTVEVGLSPSSETVVCDKTHVEQILLNLSINARDAMPDGGRLRITTQAVDIVRDVHIRGLALRPGRHACLEVADNGVGMDAVTLERLFEPFFTTKDVGRGTGLGLYTVYGIVKQMGGAIDVSSELGCGSKFSVYFPSVDSMQPSPRQQLEPGHVPPTAGSETILLVEDERLIRATLRMTLEQHGHRVLVAGNPQEALSLAAKHPGVIDVLLTDIVMPGSSGVDLARLLLLQQPEIKVVFMSAFPTEVLIREGRLPAGRRSLEKPFTDDALIAAIREALGAARANVDS